MDFLNPQGDGWIEQLTWYFSQPEFYPPFIVVTLIVIAVLIASIRFLLARQFLSFFVMWLVLLVSGAVLISFFRSSRQSFLQGSGAGSDVSTSEILTGALTQVSFDSDSNFVIFGGIALVCIFVFGFSKFRAALSPNLGARLALEGLVISLLGLVGLVLLGVYAPPGNAQQSIAWDAYKLPGLLTAGWFGIAVVFWLIAAFKRRPVRSLTVLHWLAYLAGVVLLVAPMTLTLLSDTRFLDMDYQGQFEVWNAISGYGMYCIIGSGIILGALAILAIMRKPR